MHLSPARDAPPRTPGEEQFALAAELLALLGDRTRLTLLHALTGGAADVTTLTEARGAARPAVSQHLARLRLARLVGTRKEGRRVICPLCDGRLRRPVDEALNVADHRIAGRPPHDRRGSVPRGRARVLLREDGGTGEASSTRSADTPVLPAVRPGTTGVRHRGRRQSGPTRVRPRPG
ncbi:hypothetical protein SUDANB176_01245 [Streptomyces sp. enrichment culture]